jgi:hypothetical protein
MRDLRPMPAWTPLQAIRAGSARQQRELLRMTGGRSAPSSRATFADVHRRTRRFRSPTSATLEQQPVWVMESLAASPPVTRNR